MKYFLACITVLLTLAAVPLSTEKPEEQVMRTYPKCGVVCALETAEDVVVVRDFSGKLWQFNGIEDWMIGDVVAMIMDDNGTETIFDDQIVSIRYQGTI